MKKLEIIIESVERRKVCRLLEELNVNGYTIINDVFGKGSQFTRSGSELSDIMKNSMIIVVETEDMINKIIETLKREVLNFYSGKLFLSDIIVVD